MHQKLIPDPILILLNNPKQSLHARILLQIRYFEREYQKALKKITIFLSNRKSSVMSLECHSHVISFVCQSYVLVCHLHVTHMYSYVIRILLICTRMSSICHSHVLVCHPYITHMYSYVIRMSLACTRMSSVCHSYVLVCHPYVTCMYSYAIRESLVCTRMSSVSHWYVVLPWTQLCEVLSSIKNFDL